MNATPHTPNATTVLDMENNTSVRKLLDGQEYPIAKGDIIKKGFYCKEAVEKFVAYLHGLSQLPGCPRYNSDIVTSCTCLQLLPIENNAFLGAA